MKLRHLFIAVAAALSLTACEDSNDTVSLVPTFSGFEVSCSPIRDGLPQPGDELTITAVQKTEGEHLYDAVYAWTILLKDDEVYYSKTFSGIVYSYDKSDPKLRIQVPATHYGQLIVQFTATYQCSASCRNTSTYVGHDQGYEGTITTSASELMGRAQGTATIPIAY